MSICKTCGSIIPFEGGICTKCSNQNGAGGMGVNRPGYGNPGLGNPGFGNSGFGNPGFNGAQGGINGTSPNKFEVISKLERYKQLLGECDELKAMIKPQSSFPASLENNFKTRSFMRYFWPFLIGGIVGGYGVYMVAYFITMMSAINLYGDPQMAAQRVLSDSFAALVVGLIIAAAVIFFGVKVAKRKQTDFNNNANYMNREAAERYNKGVQNQKMMALYQSNVNEMVKYEPLVPEQYRSFDQIGAIIDLLKDDKAQTVEEACAML